MLLVLNTAAAGLDVPVVRVQRPHFPLAAPTLTLSLEAFEQCTAAGNVVGLNFTPRGQTSAPVGTCGVLCELSGCHEDAEEGSSVRVRAVAFSRYRVRDERTTAAGGALPVLEVEPWLDLEPEDDPVLRERFGLTERGNALAAMEMRAHLCALGVEQLLKWNGPQVAVSPAAGLLSEEEREEMRRAVHRFAPPEAGPSLPPDACPTSPLDGCALGADSHACMLERAFLLAAAEGPDEAEGGALSAEEAARFSSRRNELYSWALARTLDLSPADAQALLEGRSTAARLSLAESQMGATQAWLRTRLGLDNQSIIDVERTVLLADAAALDGASPLAARRGHSGGEDGHGGRPQRLQERRRAVGRALRGWLSAASDVGFRGEQQTSEEA